jgi:hypothetical protein
MFQAGSIITTRIVMILATVIISASGGYSAVWPCPKIESALPHPSMLISDYPTCTAYANGTDPNGLAVVLANLTGETGVNAGAALNLSFGMALWLSVVLHAIGIEVYVSGRDNSQLPVVNMANRSSSTSRRRKRTV